ncbi:hypothetical protein [Nocardia seriolae]|nr:hypothetical protein [Nocardia seriolae]OJF82020.1 hypothetical protein NS14008_26180 [Nocardia seriolae]PSK28881.1 hypothetical protein C6575_24205 [Nocardia seriolae]QOW33895.1 hypothetical protein IMZ23_01670 [Nocardia seriolae]QUN18611.1 hypothetical protein KEC46_04065 [Nocardia seriolae]WNJ61098.1 hypothetical protein RMO66_10585 [Nocardia seriolae]
MGPNEMLALMRAGIRQLGGSWAQSADLLDSMTYPDDQWPWGPQPKHALADYVRGVCDYLPAVYPADTVERIRTISGVLFMDPLTTCTTWRIGGAETARTRKTDLAAITDPAQRAIAEITLKYFCPQLG